MNINDPLFLLLQSFLKSINNFNLLFARYVTVQEQSVSPLGNLTTNLPIDMTPEIVKALIDALNSLAALIATDATNIAAANAARQKAEQDLATLQATDAALQDPALVSAAQAAIAAAQAAQPPPAA